jgi:16S rRNA (guanine1207-N2)-methyltransferase
MSIPKNHYFNSRPEVPSRQHTVRLRSGELDLQLIVDRGVFGARGIDLGTLTLLKEAPAPPAAGEVLDLGAGYGPIAIFIAKASPSARVWAVDVNERAVELSRANAVSAGTPNVVASLPEEVPPELRFDAIYSNPPVRVGKHALREMLVRWLQRLAPDGRAHLVIQRNLGSDSLVKWLREEGWTVERIKSKKGYRVITVARPKPPSG